ncbi:MAG: type II secretion system protein [Planctomycetes bacterium]|nr:type II secretion system protein [Planctomycetota bacterium]
MLYSAKKKCGGFTLVELLVALSISGFILAAVATLAFAMGSAYDSSDDTMAKQSRVRTTKTVLRNLLCDAKMVFLESDGDLAVWKSDDGDNRIEDEELVYIEKGIYGNHLYLVSYKNTSGLSTSFSITNIEDGSAKNFMNFNCARQTVKFLDDDCRNVWFRFDSSPPSTRLVSIAFELLENGQWKQYHMSCYLSGWAGNLLDGMGNSLISDDD